MFKIHFSRNNEHISTLTVHSKDCTICLQMALLIVVQIFITDGDWVCEVIWQKLLRVIGQASGVFGSCYDLLLHFFTSLYLLHWKRAQPVCVCVLKLIYLYIKQVTDIGCSSKQNEPWKRRRMNKLMSLYYCGTSRSPPVTGLCTSPHNTVNIIPTK